MIRRDQDCIRGECDLCHFAMSFFSLCVSMASKARVAKLSTLCTIRVHCTSKLCHNILLHHSNQLHVAPHHIEFQYYAQFFHPVPFIFILPPNCNKFKEASRFKSQILLSIFPNRNVYFLSNELNQETKIFLQLRS